MKKQVRKIDYAHRKEKMKYKYIMIKEINEIPQKVEKLLSVIKKYPSVSGFVNEIIRANNVYIIGAGTSFYAGLLGAYYFNRIARKAVFTAFAAEFIDRFGNSFTDKDVLICISQSGETKDVKNVLDFCYKRKHKKILSIVNTENSSIAARSKYFIPTVCDIEIAVPATKTFVNQVIVMLYLAVEFAKKTGVKTQILYRDLEKLPGLLEKTIETTEKTVKFVAELLAGIKDFYNVGYGLTYPISLEGALKVKETSYIHCEGMYSSEFKHGPISIVTKNYPVIFVIAKPDEKVLLGHIKEVSSRGGKILTISPEDKEIIKRSDFHITLPETNYFLTPILAVIPLQLLAYHLSVEKGYNPDKPRNITKTVTTA